MPNPFTPAPFGKPDPERRRRERFKISVYAVLAVLGLALAGMLIQGCHVQRGAEAVPAEPGVPVADSATVSTNTAAIPGVPQDTNATTAPALPAEPSRLAAESVPSAAAVAAPTNNPSLAAPAAATPAAPTRYVIKRGDTLLRIAKTHHTTVKAIKLANGLTTDRILAGQVLNLRSPGSPGQS